MSPNNTDRTTEVVNAHRNASKDGADKELSAQAKHQLQTDTTFQLLTTTIEAIPVGDHVATAKAMLEAKHGAGLLFLNGKINHDKWMKERGGARTLSAIQSIFNTAVSYTTAGVAAEWGRSGGPSSATASAKSGSPANSPCTFGMSSQDGHR